MARRDDTRLRILDTALQLLTEGGRDAVSTRAVTTAADIQAPTLYRIFGDKQGLLDAVAAYGFANHLSTWQGWQPGAHPVDVIRQGWDLHIRWGVENPYLYSIAYGDARPGTSTSAAGAIDAILTTLVEQAAAAGYLRIPVTDAVNMLRAVGTGVVFTLIALPEQTRDYRLSERGREAVLGSILDLDENRAVPALSDRSSAAMQLKTTLDEATELTGNERALLGDWLDRVAAGSPAASS